MPYDELVKRLRHSANFAERGLTPPPSELREAADAIEERCQQVDKFAEEAARLYAKLPRWIPVTDRLPKADEYDERGYAVPYLVMNGWMRVTARRTKDYWVLFGNSAVLEYVTHWMPLPEPPEEE